MTVVAEKRVAPASLFFCYLRLYFCLFFYGFFRSDAAAPCKSYPTLILFSFGAGFFMFLCPSLPSPFFFLVPFLGHSPSVYRPLFLLSPSVAPAFFFSCRGESEKKRRCYTPSLSSFVPSRWTLASRVLLIVGHSACCLLTGREELFLLLVASVWDTIAGPFRASRKEGNILSSSVQFEMETRSEIQRVSVPSIFFFTFSFGCVLLSL